MWHATFNETVGMLWRPSYDIWAVTAPDGAQSESKPSKSRRSSTGTYCRVVGPVIVSGSEPWKKLLLKSITASWLADRKSTAGMVPLSSGLPETTKLLVPSARVTRTRTSMMKSEEDGQNHEPRQEITL